MGYWFYYAAILLAAYLAQHPWILAGLVVVFLARRWVPDPWVLLRTFARVRSLRAQIEANPANVTARRDLARIYLERMRPRAALRLLDEARRRTPEEPELLFLTGLARHRAGRSEEALEPLVAAVSLDPRVGFGECYLVAGDALTELGRHEEAVDAYERYVETSSSSIEGWTKLALAERRAGHAKDAADALAEALRTWEQIPRYKRRKEIFWFLRAQVYRLWL